MDFSMVINHPAWAYPFLGSFAAMLAPDAAAKRNDDTSFFDPGGASGEV